MPGKSFISILVFFFFRSSNARENIIFYTSPMPSAINSHHYSCPCIITSHISYPSHIIIKAHQHSPNIPLLKHSHRWHVIVSLLAKRWANDDDAMCQRQRSLCEPPHGMLPVRLDIRSFMDMCVMYAICRLEDYCRLKFERHRRHCHTHTHANFYTPNIYAYGTRIYA